MILISQELQNEYLFSTARPHLLKNKKDVPKYTAHDAFAFCNQPLKSSLFFAPTTHGNSMEMSHLRKSYMHDMPAGYWIVPT